MPVDTLEQAFVPPGFDVTLELTPSQPSPQSLLCREHAMGSGCKTSKSQAGLGHAVMKHGAEQPLL
jgi:hypothetical protein